MAYERAGARACDTASTFSRDSLSVSLKISQALGVMTEPRLNESIVSAMDIVAGITDPKRIVPIAWLWSTLRGRMASSRSINIILAVSEFHTADSTE